MTLAKTIIILGLDNSHPFVDAANLLALDPTLVFVLVVDGVNSDRRDTFLAEFPGTVLAASLQAALRLSPIGVLVTLRPSSLLAVLPELVAGGVPAFINKQGLATRAQLDAALPMLARHPHRLMTSSVLRFSPDVRDTVVDRGRLRAIHVSIRHGVEHWKQPGNEWQDDIREGGSIVGSLGYHGFDLLDELAGEGFVVDAATVDSGHHTGVPCGDHALITGHWPDGPAGAIEIDATVTGESYDARLIYDDDDVLITLDPMRDDGFGYRCAMATFLHHIVGVTAPTWERSLSLLKQAATAHQLAYGETTRAPMTISNFGENK